MHLCHKPSLSLVRRPQLQSPRSTVGFRPSCPRNQRPQLCTAAQDRFGFSSSFGAMDAAQFEAIERQMVLMQQQMDRDFSSVFGNSAASLNEMQREMRSDLQRINQQVDADWQKALQDAQQARIDAQARVPEVTVQRQESGAPGSYQYRHSVHISISPGGSYDWQASAQPPATASSPFSPFLLVAAVTFGAYAAFTTAFLRNYHLTQYTEGPKKWLLALLWPALIVVSEKFRAEFRLALQGAKEEAESGTLTGTRPGVPGFPPLDASKGLEEVLKADSSRRKL